MMFVLEGALETLAVGFVVLLSIVQCRGVGVYPTAEYAVHFVDRLILSILITTSLLCFFIVLLLIIVSLFYL